MKKSTIRSIVIGTLITGSLLWVQAYSTNIWSSVQFVKQLFATPNGEVDTSKATIKIDGTNGRIDAKSIYENGKEVSTKAYVNSKTKDAWAFKKNGTNAYYSSWNVWIWTTDPQKKLYVVWSDSKAIAVFENKDTSNNGQVNISLKSNGWDYAWIKFHWPNRTVNQKFNFDITYNFPEKKLYFIDGESWINKPRMVLTHDWKLWIWTTDPQTTLDIMDTQPQAPFTAHTTLAVRNTKLWWSAVVALQWWNWVDAIKFFGARWNINDTNNKDKFVIKYIDNQKKLYMWYANKKDVTITSDWNVWIWTDNPQEKLDVNGTIIANDYNIRSDRRYKKNIKELTGSLKKIMKLKGYSYIFKSTGKHDIWLIAQEVEKVYPNLVSTGKDGYKSVEYQNLVAPLIESVKEQQKEINKQQEEIDLLKKEIELLKRK